ncbi:hypothetical protein ACOMCU_15860 [Lysinibacillus sp. UGB7]|uniref:hypothetical protein n=1 Tax=Lysinibacillus sp. UGB7 TaxID=3411039 RepID=UPI003B80550E
MQYSEYRNIHGKWGKRMGYISGVGKLQELNGRLPYKNNLLIEGVTGKGMSYYSNLKLNLQKPALIIP